MKLFKNAEKEIKSKIVTTDAKLDLVGLKAFTDKYPDNATTSLVYFNDGMTPVSSPFTSIIGLSKTIAEEDPAVIKRFIDREAYNSLEGFMLERKGSIMAQFAARCNFLSRSLMMNVEQKIFQAIAEVCNTTYIQSIVDETSERLASGFYRGITDPSFCDTVDADIDFLTTYSFNTILIPGLIAEFYDKYDKIIVQIASRHFPSQKKAAEENHMQILYKIVPVFEMLKSQLEWLNYMLRSEAETIYRPMAMLPVENILDEYYKSEFEKLTPSKEIVADNYRTAITQALDAGDDMNAKQLLEQAEREGIDTGIKITTFDHRSDAEKLIPSNDLVEEFQDNMIEAAKENPNIKTTVF